MISKSCRDLAQERYLGQSETYKKITQICSDIRTSFENYLKEHTSAESIQYMAKYPDRISVQGDIDLTYEADVPWEWRRVIFDSMLNVQLAKLNFPRLFPSPSFMFCDNSEFDKEFTNEIKKKIKSLGPLVKTLTPELEALDKALSEKTMNKTSIKEYYPELYNLMYND